MLMWFCYNPSEQIDKTKESAESSRTNRRFAAVEQTRGGIA
jgi:hypothetical protein